MLRGSTKAPSTRAFNDERDVVRALLPSAPGSLICLSHTSCLFGLPRRFRDAMCPGSGNKTAEDAFFGPSGMLNSLTTGFVVVTNLTVDRCVECLRNRTTSHRCLPRCTTLLTRLCVFMQSHHGSIRLCAELHIHIHSSERAVHCCSNPAQAALPCAVSKRHGFDLPGARSSRQPGSSRQDIGRSHPACGLRFASARHASVNASYQRQLARVSSVSSTPTTCVGLEPELPRCASSRSVAIFFPIESGV